MQRRFIYILPIMMLVWRGCESVIDLDLNEAGSTVVIEANLHHPEGMLLARVSKTASYFQPDSIQNIEGASVYLENIEGKQLKATETGNGLYILDNVHSETGDWFKLTVESGQEIYWAVSTVQEPVEIDSVEYIYYPGDSFFRGGYRFNLTFTDPPGKKNYYRVRVHKNGYTFKTPNDLVVFDDTDMDGDTFQVHLHSQFYLQQGETAEVELMSIDREAWEYFTSLEDLIKGNPDSPAPGNPASNFSNGALGHFYVWSSSRKSVFIEN